MKRITLTAIFDEAEGTEFVGSVAELPGFKVPGESIEETRTKLQDAVKQALKSLRAEAEIRRAINNGVEEELVLQIC